MSASLQIRNFLAPSFAERLYEMLDREAAWELAFLGDRGPVCVPLDEVERMSPEDRAALDAQIAARARSAFQFRFCRYPVSPEQRVRFEEELGTLRTELARRARELTGDQGIATADMQASYYPPGSYLMEHDDALPSQDRRCAYVLHLAREWSEEWGGVLELLSPDHRVVRRMTPEFNSLVLFRTPQPHRVTIVTAAARAKRYALHGWCLGG